MRTDKNQSYFSINNIPVKVLLTEGWEQKLWLVIFGEKKNKKFTESNRNLQVSTQRFPGWKLVIEKSSLKS